VATAAVASSEELPVDHDVQLGKYCAVHAKIKSNCSNYTRRNQGGGDCYHDAAHVSVDYV
jgi:hypothetical protein